MSTKTSKEEPKKGDSGKSSEDPVKDDAVAEVESKDKAKENALDSVFGNDYNRKEAMYVIVAAILIAFNNGFVNGVCLSGFLTEDSDLSDPRDLRTAMVSGTAGYVTQSTIGICELDWKFVGTNSILVLCYMFGAYIPAVLSPKAKPYAIDPLYGPAFFIGATMLLLASLVSVSGGKSRYIYWLAMASNGVQNGIASIYSANLIRCTLTGALTDIAIVIGRLTRGNNTNIGRGIVLSVIVTSFWVGGFVSYPIALVCRSYTLVFNAGLFYMVGFLCTFYLVDSLHISFADALVGNWDWTDVLAKITPSGDKESLLNLFDTLDHDEGGSLDIHELEKGLEDKVSEAELKTLLQAADADGDGEIDKDEWIALVNKLYAKYDDDSSENKAGGIEKVETKEEDA